MTVLDSGERTEFQSGAVRDCATGKGRCDLMPLDVLGSVFDDTFLQIMDDFEHNGLPQTLATAIKHIVAELFKDNEYNAMLELSVHFEEGCNKYGARNWQKGIPAQRYVDSAVRHYIKFMRGDTDERHDRACLWNLVCCLWTCEEMPELNEYAKHILKKVEANE